MAQRSKHISKVLIPVGILYGVYLLKTLLGINLSSQHSAPWVLKAPLVPLEIGKDHLCQEQEVEAACVSRKAIHRKLQQGIRKLVS